MPMKYIIKNAPGPGFAPSPTSGLRYGPVEFNTPEEAFAAIPERVRRVNENQFSPKKAASDYVVVCESDNGPSVILTSPPVAGTVQLDHNASSANPKQAYGDKKLPVHLVPPALVLITAPNMGDGAEKYGAYNWRHKKVEAMTYVGAIQRHLAAYLDGEDVDPESKRGATHLGAIAACVAILADASMMGNLIDNRPPRGKAGDHIRERAGVVLPQKEGSK